MRLAYNLYITTLLQWALKADGLIANLGVTLHGGPVGVIRDKSTIGKTTEAAGTSPEAADTAEDSHPGKKLQADSHCFTLMLFSCSSECLWWYT